MSQSHAHRGGAINGSPQKWRKWSKMEENGRKWSEMVFARFSEAKPSTADVQAYRSLSRSAKARITCTWRSLRLSSPTRSTARLIDSRTIAVLLPIAPLLTRVSSEPRDVRSLSSRVSGRDGLERVGKGCRSCAYSQRNPRRRVRGGRCLFLHRAQHLRPPGAHDRPAARASRPSLPDRGRRRADGGSQDQAPAQRIEREDRAGIGLPSRSSG